MVVIPTEIRESIESISTEKKKEIEITLSQIFAGTSKWKEQVNAIEVAGIDDKMSIQLAEVARKNAKDARLSAEKMLDLKREEVQKLKIEFDTEDKMWLKVKQIVQITFKEIESPLNRLFKKALPPSSAKPRAPVASPSTAASKAPTVMCCKSRGTRWKTIR